MCIRDRWRVYYWDNVFSPRKLFVSAVAAVPQFFVCHPRRHTNAANSYWRKRHVLFTATSTQATAGVVSQAPAAAARVPLVLECGNQQATGASEQSASFHAAAHCPGYLSDFFDVSSVIVIHKGGSISKPKHGKIMATWHMHRAATRALTSSVHQCNVLDCQPGVVFV